ncbi:MAG: hypothetical protein ACKVRO_02680 [Micropepsaceae bacterium]
MAVSGRLAKRLQTYWRLEAANVVLLPFAVLLMVATWDGSPNLTLAVALAVNSFLLVIGACYWRIVLLRVEGDPGPFARWLPRLAAAEPAALALTVLTVAVTAYDLATGGGTWPPERIAAIAMTALAVLEYVNYYRFHLQYFDHAPDFVALMKRKTLKRAHMARDIAGWHAKRAPPHIARV